MSKAPCLPANELARYKCNDCGVNVVEIGELYMLRPEIWEGQLGLGWDDNLCIGCLETRLGRRLRPGIQDFAASLVTLGCGHGPIECATDLDS